LFVTHEREIAQHTQRIVHIRDGRIQSDEPVAQPLIAAEVLANTPAKIDA
jgi:putative ABC transport system ATP-binding protein